MIKTENIIGVVFASIMTYMTYVLYHSIIITLFFCIILFIPTFMSIIRESMRN